MVVLFTGGGVALQFLAFWTVLQFGWRIFSRLAIDFRKKDAQQRLRLYLSRALFLTFEKLDLQFLVHLAEPIYLSCAQRSKTGRHDR